MTAHGSARFRLASLDERHGRACFLKARHGRALSRTSCRRESRLKSQWPGRRRLRARVQRAVRSSSSDVQRAVGRSIARLLFLLPWRVPEAPNDTDRRRPVQAKSAAALEGSLKPHGRPLLPGSRPEPRARVICLNAMGRCMDGDGKIACSQSTGQCRSVTRGPCLMLWPRGPPHHSLPRSLRHLAIRRCRVRRPPRPARAAPPHRVDEKMSRDGAEPCTAPKSCGSQEFADIG
jgi:hypothetical protein